MLLSQVIRGAAITGRTDVVGTRLLGRQGGRWTQQWVDSAFPGAAARTHGAPRRVQGPSVASARGAPPPPDPAALEDLRRRGILTDDEVERMRGPRRA
jgi:hypothetical protein